jgi:Amt family ammonium transporter
VGAVAVHGVCGAWGTIAAGLLQVNAFSLEQVGIQFIGVAAAFLWAFPMSFLVFSLIDQAIGLRITLLDKAIGLLQVDGGGRTLGLDRLEHDVEAYPEFVTAEEQPESAKSTSTGKERTRQPVAP